MIKEFFLHPNLLFPSLRYSESSKQFKLIIGLKVPSFNKENGIFKGHYKLSLNNSPKKNDFKKILR